MTARPGPDADGSVTVFGVRFQNPVLLAAGTCGFGREVSDVVDLEALGGLVTKSVTPEPRSGNAAPRLSEVGVGMLNSVGLANPGATAVRDEKLPWLRDTLRRARVVVSVAAHTVDGYAGVVSTLDGEDGFVAYELNLSCPNDARLGGRPFALDPAATRGVIAACRPRTQRPLLAKLAPNDPDLPGTIAAAEGAGADGVVLVNTMPGLAFLPDSDVPSLGAGAGGMSGPALKPIGLEAVRRARDATDLPIVGVGGILTARDALDYLRAGASLVQIGTATFAAPRTAERVARGVVREVAR